MKGTYSIQDERDAWALRAASGSTIRSGDRTGPVVTLRDSVVMNNFDAGTVVAGATATL